MKKNDLFEIEITDMSASGEGIGHYEGMTFFIKDAIIGDAILARATKLKSSYGYARVEEVRTPSPFRITPPCPLHRRCGGCQIQAMAYPAQLQYKQNKVRENLIRIGGFTEEQLDAVMEPPVGMDTSPYRYRNKAQFPVGTDSHGNIVMGFYAAHSHDIIPVDDCLLGVEINQPILAIIKAWMQQYAIAPYHEATGKGIVRHILIRYGFQSGQIMVCLIINAKKLPHAQELAGKLARIEGMTSISFNINQENTNVILGKKTVCIWGQGYIEDSIRLWEVDCTLNRNLTGQSEPLDGSRMECEVNSNGFQLTNKKITYHISPQSFYQVNPLQTEKLYSTALSYAGLTGKEYVWDLYCGIGTISLFLAQRAKQVYGVEVVPQAIEDARANAKRNGITNAEFFVGRAEEVLPEFYHKSSLRRCLSLRAEDAEGGDKQNIMPEILDLREGDGETADVSAWDDETPDMSTGDDGTADMSHPDVIVVDPPRKGCDAKCLETMLRMRPERIVYVSCDSATLARDLKVLCEGGYELKKARIFDQFAHTVHVETCALITKSSKA